MQNRQKNFSDRVRTPWRGLKKAHWHIRVVKKIFSNPLMMGIKNTEFYVDFKNIKLY
jgi:hypothetical protein